jgi:hypothetical protein
MFSMRRLRLQQHPLQSEGIFRTWLTNPSISKNRKDLEDLKENIRLWGL